MGDRGRRARAAAAQPELRRHDAPSSGARSTRSARRPSGGSGGCSNCGKGEPGQLDARLARRRAGALPRRRRWAWRDEPALELAERALGRRRRRRRRARPRDARALADDALRALAADPGDRGRRPDRRVVRCVRDGHVGSATTNATDGGALAGCARAAAAAAEAAARTRGAGRVPGLSRRPRPAAPAQGYDAATARLDPAAGGAALGGGVRRGGAPRASRRTEPGRPARSRRRSPRAPASRRSERVTDAFMKVGLHRARRPQRLCRRAAVAAAGIDPARDRPSGRRRRRPPPASRSRLEPGEYQVVLEADAVGELLALAGALRLQRAAPTPRDGARWRAARARASRRPRSTCPTRPGTRGRCRAPSTPRACRRRRCR